MSDQENQENQENQLIDSMNESELNKMNKINEIDEHNWKEKLPELCQKLETANQKAQANWELLLRKEAECQNIQRRSSQEVENARKFAIEGLAGELLNVVDNFERALETPLIASEQDKILAGFIEGIKLTQKGLLDSLAKFGITQINPLGEVFDPQFHEALSAQESLEVKPDTILAVYAKGYLLKGRLLRPARVVVSRADTAEGA